MKLVPFMRIQLRDCATKPSSSVNVTRWLPAGNAANYVAIHNELNFKELVYYDPGDLDTFVMSLKLRVLQVVPEVDDDDDLWNRLKKDSRWLANQIKKQSGFNILDDDDIEKYIRNNYSGKKRDSYLKALSSLKDYNILQDLGKDAKISAFLKREKLELKEESKRKGRVIQGRGDPNFPRFLVWFFRLKCAEKLLYEAKALFNPLDNTREVAKEQNPRQRAAELLAKVNSLVDPVLISTDCSAFDAHVNTKQLEIEEEFYGSLLRSGNHGDYGVFKTLFKHQKYNRGQARFKEGKVSYSVEGCRASGDWNTAFGNVLLVSLFTRRYMLDLGVPNTDWRMYDDGDDCILLVERRYANVIVDGYENYFKRIGHNIKIESVVSCKDDIERIEFCQSHPINTYNGWVMARNYEKMISSYFLDCRWLKTKDLAMKYYSAVGTADSILYAGVPIISVLANRMRDLSGVATIQDITSLGEWRFGCLSKVVNCDVPITHASRLSFEKAYGLTPSQQVLYEEILSSIDPFEAY